MTDRDCQPDDYSVLPVSTGQVLYRLSGFQKPEQWPVISNVSILSSSHIENETTCKTSHASNGGLVAGASLGAEDVRIELGIDLTSHRFWFEGHFPDHPVLPGIVQVNWASEFCRRLFAPRSFFSNLQSIKFQQTIAPDDAVVLELMYNVERSRAVFQYRDSDRVFSSGRVHFSGSE